MVSGYFVWWYSTGINQAYTIAVAAMTRVTDNFSLLFLLKTLLAPWKNDVLIAHNASLADQLKVWQLNLASRLIGFLIRTVVILVSVCLLLLMVVATGIGLALWVATPLLVIILPLVGVTRLFT